MQIPNQQTSAEGTQERALWELEKKSNSTILDQLQGLVPQRGRPTKSTQTPVALSHVRTVASALLLATTPTNVTARVQDIMAKTARYVSLKPTPDTVHYILTHFKGLWNVINNIPFLRDAIMGYVLTCKTELPDVKILAEKLLLRRKFIPDPQRTSLMFAFFAQHFTHQFFKTDMKKGAAFTRAKNHGVDLSHIYGEELERQHKLRLFRDGKLRYQVLDGEVYPPMVSEVQVDMHYPPHVPESHRFAVGHEAFGLVPGLLMYATLWLREHNRVCDILKKEHPDWDDERLFQTTRLILIGETIKIVIEDYVQHLSGYHFKLKFDPEILFNQRFQYQNRISSEFNTLYHWHPLMPEDFHIQDEVYSYSQFLFNTTMLTDYGISNLVESFTNQVAGRVAGGRNVGRAVLMVAMKSLENSRQMRFQSLNAYRKRFNMKPYVSFEDLTGEQEMSAELEELYGDVEAVELYTGLLVEKPRPNSIFGETMVEMGAPYSLKGLLGNPICSPEYWKPSTFGGRVGFNIVNTASLQKLVCDNVKGPCPIASFHVPDVKDSVQGTINASTAHSRQNEVNPTVLLKERSSEL
ncbi:hypothetical protein P4O66_001015 [Electrophorus voltai]|uniref:Prostaglandin-endoperoxide synthase n=1 Tax=Electrophorus voltai TaxID=2609070 RepID=A0AAD9DWD1_9TELE|nr:hypothetical protein P4O66_001015 [Electrophorus voltai]